MTDFRSFGETARTSAEIDAEIASQDSLLNGTVPPLPHLSPSREILVSLSWVFSVLIHTWCLTPSSLL